jgi:hypothetical protein
VLVIVITVGSMTVPIMLVVDVIAVPDGRMPAGGAVHMLVAGMSQVRQRMLVVMGAVGRMGVALVHVVDVPLALDARVAASRAVYVLVTRMNVIIVGCHSSSLLCWTASATMCATC